MYSSGIVLFRKSMVNVRIRLYKKVPDNIKKLDNFIPFKRIEILSVAS